MKRYALIFCCLFLVAAPAMATSEFNKQWKAKYLSGDDVTDEFKKKAKGAGCYICHIKGHKDKKKARNEYGIAVNKFLKAKEFPKDYVKENPDEAKEKIQAGFKKANEMKSKEGGKFAEKIKAGKLPAVDGLPPKK